ncbi:hypothetical protein RI367_004435 [Sorochytrium milnesiophthora]
MASSGDKAAANLAALSEQTSDKITSTLQNAFITSRQIYTKLGETMLVAVTTPLDSDAVRGNVDPLKRITSNDVLRDWQQEYRKVSSPETDDVLDGSLDPQPHIFSLANAAYLQLKKTQQPQAILVHGKSGSMKGVHTHLLLRYLGSLSGTSKTSKLYRKLLAADTLLHAFGDTHYVPSTQGGVQGAGQEAVFSSSSRFVNAVEMQFSEKGKLVGCRRDAFGLDTEKVVSQGSNETCFGVFHVLLNDSDMSQTFRTELHLTDAATASYPYVSNKLANTQLYVPATFVSDSDTLETKSHVYSPLTYDLIKDAMKTVGFNRRYQACIFKMLAGILHLGTIRFTDGLGNQHDACQVENRDVLANTAQLLGTTVDALEFALTSAMKRVGKDWCTVLMKAAEAVKQRDKLARSLYTALFGWLVHVINHRLVRFNAVQSIRIVETPDRAMTANNKTPSPSLWDFAVAGFVRDKLESITLDAIFQRSADVLRREVADDSVNVPEWMSNDDVVAFYTDSRSGAFGAFDEVAGREASPESNSAQELLDAIERRRERAKEPNGAVFARLNGISFAVKNNIETDDPAASKDSYNALSFVERNSEIVGVEFVNAFQKSNMSPLLEVEEVTSADLLKMLFSGKVLQELYGEQAAEQWYPTMSALRSTRKSSSSSKRKGKTDSTSGDTPSMVALLAARIDRLQNDLKASTLRHLFCIQHSDSLSSPTLDSRRVLTQVKQLQLSEVAQWCKTWGGDYAVRYQHDEFCARYSALGSSATASDSSSVRSASNSPAACRSLLEKVNLHGPQYKATVGKTSVLLGHTMWLNLEARLRKVEGANKKDKKESKRSRGRRPGDLETLASLDGTDDEGGSVLDNESVISHETLGRLPNEAGGSSADKPAGADGVKGGDVAETQEEKTVEEIIVSSDRRRWVFLTKMLTWWVPTAFLRWCGGMDRSDIQMAWREKFAICIIIGFACACQLFFIIGLSRIICPKQNMYNLAELYYKQTAATPYVAIYGSIYNMNDFYQLGTYHSPDVMGMYAGLDITAGFPRTASHYCTYAAQYQPDFPNLFDPSSYIANGTLIQGNHAMFYAQDLTNAELAIDARLKQLRVKYLGWDPTDVAALAKSVPNVQPQTMFIVNGIVYNLQPYLNIISDQTKDFFPSGLMTYLKDKGGKDLTTDTLFMNIWNNDANLRTCWNNLFTAGITDLRKSPKCVITNNVLLGFTVLLCTVIFVKFLAALLIGSKGEPEDYDKFAIIQVPCYTEGAESMRKTINSLASMTYDDKRKLLFLVCDGNIIGSGNDKPTPRIVLDILGVDPEYDPEPLSFQSIGEGMKQFNMGKVYSGLYEVSGHLVPYIVVVKVGAANETRRPGNRGKRDSQMILMRFLNKVYFDSPMSPLELEMYHQIKNVIGVDPALYEYCLMVDADTTVSADSLTRLVGAMVNDIKVMGVCGETRLSNEKDTWATMIQVYEYYISHHLAKAFESVFGSVTCLPGCFCMYRIRSTNKGSPLLVSNGIIEEYSICDVDTLHKKNLLSLGEDRYLTTLMLKHFPNYRTIFTPDAICTTLAPENWNVLLSQRRRWINSTVHNLVELLNIPQLCGFLCFSMRFVVFIDLLATLIQPAIVGYLAYLIYTCVTSYLDNDGTFPLVSLILLGAVYGVQALIFLIKKEWQHIGWMVIYILAIPVFSFFIPVYSFWHMDDFSWGNTRIVVGESALKQVIVSTDEKFDLRMIPHKKWKDYEQELMAQFAANGDNMSDADSIMMAAAAGMGIDQKLGSSSTLNGNNSRYSMVGGGMDPRRLTMMTTMTAGNNNSRPMSTMSSLGYYMGKPQQPSVNSPIAVQTPATPTLEPVAGSPQTPVGAGGAAMPTDEMLYFEIRRIISSADLMTLTKKKVRDELSGLFGVDLTPKKAFITKTINDAIKERQA